MKKFLLLISFIVSLTCTVKATSWILPKNQDSGLYQPNVSMIQPGDTILLYGNYGYIYLTNIQGADGKPIVITNIDSVTTGIASTNYDFIVEGNYWKVDGSHNPKYRYGIRCFNNITTSSASCFLFGNSSNWEIKKCELEHGEVGIFSNPTTGVPMLNINIDSNYIHDIDCITCGTGEGMYLGNTGIGTINFPCPFKNLNIFGNYLDSLDGDGIQVANAQGYNIYNNIVKYWGTENWDDQHTAFLGGGNSWGNIYNNYCYDGTGFACSIFGDSTNNIYNNQFINSGQSTNQPSGIYILKKGIDGGKLQVNITGNVINGAQLYGIDDEDTLAIGLPGNICSNEISNIGFKDIFTYIDYQCVPLQQIENNLSASYSSGTITLLYQTNVDPDSLEESTDGKNFKAIDIVNDTNGKYSFSAAAGTYYFRSAVKGNVSLVVSVVVPITPKITESYNSRTKTITVTSNAKGAYDIFNMMSTEVAKGSVNVGNTFINISNLKTGVYALEIIAGSIIQTFKINK